MFDFLEENNIKDTTDYALMIMYYDSSRAEQIFIERDISLRAIIPEAVIYEEYPEEIRSFYEQYGFNKIVGIKKDSPSTFNGMSKLYAVPYVNEITGEIVKPKDYRIHYK